MFELGGETLPPALAHNLMRLIAEQDDALHATAVALFLRLLDRPYSKPLPGVLLNCVCWVLGEYGSLAEGLNSPQRATVAQVNSELVCEKQFLVYMYGMSCAVFAASFLHQQFELHLCLHFSVPMVPYLLFSWRSTCTAHIYTVYSSLACILTSGRGGAGYWGRWPIHNACCCLFSTSACG